MESQRKKRMKKRFYIGSAFALLTMAQIHAANTVSCQSLSKQEAQTVLESCKKPVKTITAQAIETYSNETCVPTRVSYTLYRDNTVERKDAKIEYDATGQIVKISQDANNYIEFIYTNEYEGKWITMEAHSFKDGQLAEKKQTVRTFDKQRRITEITLKDFDFLNTAWNITREVAFDYDHTSNADEAVTIKDIKYLKRSNGTEYKKGYEYVWYGPKNKYYYGTFDGKQDISYKVDGNILYSSSLTLNEDGQVESQFYTKREYKQIAPDTGLPMFEISESTDNINWTWNKMTQESVNFDSSSFDLTKDQESECYTYDIDDKGSSIHTELNNRVKYEFIQHPTLKLIKVTTWSPKKHYSTDNTYWISEERTVEYRPVSESGIIGKFREDFYLHDNGSYTFVTKGKDEYFIGYSSDGKQLAKQRIHMSDKREYRPYVALESYNSKGNYWNSSAHAKAGFGNSDKLRRIETNEYGFVMKDEEYRGVESQSHVVLERYTTYEYGDNSYLAEHHEMKYGVTEKDILTAKEERKTFEDGTSELVCTAYNEDGNIESRIKYVYGIDGLTYHYDWDESTNDWKNDYSNVTVDDK